MHSIVWAWMGFLAVVLVILAVDLGLLNRKVHAVSIREALLLTGGLAVLALLFNVGVWFAYDHAWFGLGSHFDRVDGTLNSGRLAAVKFFTGYLIELSLSADNVFVMALIFSHLRVPAAYQHRVLFWGVLGALVMRGAMIFAGTALVSRYHWVLYGFALFLLYTAYRMLTSHDQPEVGSEEAFVITQLRKVVPITGHIDGPHFISREGGVLMLTPLAVALILVESMDLLFALDSIPAAIAITTDPFLVFTSNVFAIMGLRSLYFVLAGAMERFRYLKRSLAAILGLIGAKMLLANFLRDVLGPNANFYVLGAVVGILATGALASLRAERKHEMPG